MLDIVECPRDAMQGIKHHIPTRTKIDYINTLLKVGFHTIDFGSFVSPKAIPQMADTAEVIKGLDRKGSRSKLLAIVANARGASDAALYEEVDILGYPFSISEQFQLRNTNATIEDSLGRVEEISSICTKSHKELVVYVSMAFGNPYGEKWHPDVAIYWTKRLYDEFGVKVIALSDTIGSSNVQSIDALFSALIPELPEVRFGAHLHTTPDSWREKVNAAYMAGCRRFDGAIKGFGGCPMADDELTGNMPTEKLLEYAAEKAAETGINQTLFDAAMLQAATVFP